jgi:hypothetical protein
MIYVASLDIRITLNRAILVAGWGEKEEEGTTTTTVSLSPQQHHGARLTCGQTTPLEWTRGRRRRKEATCVATIHDQAAGQSRRFAEEASHRKAQDARMCLPTTIGGKRDSWDASHDEDDDDAGECERQQRSAYRAGRWSWRVDERKCMCAERE